MKYVSSCLRARPGLFPALVFSFLVAGCGGGGGGAPAPAPLPTQTSTYDASGRLTAVTLPDGRTITYTYDASGNLTGKTVN